MIGKIKITPPSDRLCRALLSATRGQLEAQTTGSQSVVI